MNRYFIKKRTMFWEYNPHGHSTVSRIYAVNSRRALLIYYVEVLGMTLTRATLHCIFSFRYYVEEF